jgi:hypothetical protein
MSSAQSTQALLDGAAPLSLAIKRLVWRRLIREVKRQRVTSPISIVGMFRTFKADFIEMLASGSAIATGFNTQLGKTETIDISFWNGIRLASRSENIVHFILLSDSIYYAGLVTEGIRYANVILEPAPKGVPPMAVENEEYKEQKNKGGRGRKPAWAAEAAIAARIISDSDYTLTRSEFLRVLEHNIDILEINDPHKEQELVKLCDAIYEYRKYELRHPPS